MVIVTIYIYIYIYIYIPIDLLSISFFIDLSIDSPILTDPFGNNLLYTTYNINFSFYLEIIKEAKTDRNSLKVSLRSVNKHELEPQCLERALIAAVKVGNHSSVGILIVKGAKNIDEALDISMEMNKPYVRAILLLVKCAQENDINLLYRLFNIPTEFIHVSKINDNIFNW